MPLFFNGPRSTMPRAASAQPISQSLQRAIWLALSGSRSPVRQTSVPYSAARASGRPPAQYAQMGPIELVPEFGWQPLDKSRNLRPEQREPFRRALESFADLSPTKAQIFDRVFEFEGGHKLDGASNATAGVTPETLNEYWNDFYRANRDAHRAEGRQDDPRYAPSQLNEGDIIGFMRWYERKNMGDLSIDEIATPSERRLVGSPKLAGQIYDTVYRFGVKDGGNLVQRGINQVITNHKDRIRGALVLSGSTREEADQAVKGLDPDGKLGPLTKQALEAVLRIGLGDELSRQIGVLRRADEEEKRRKRGALKKDKPKKDNSDGELENNESYRSKAFE